MYQWLGNQQQFLCSLDHEINNAKVHFCVTVGIASEECDEMFDKSFTLLSSSSVTYLIIGFWGLFDSFVLLLHLSV